MTFRTFSLNLLNINGKFFQQIFFVRAILVLFQYTLFRTEYFPLWRYIRVLFIFSDACKHAYLVFRRCECQDLLSKSFNPEAEWTTRSIHKGWMIKIDQAPKVKLIIWSIYKMINSRWKWNHGSIYPQRLNEQAEQSAKSIPWMPLPTEIPSV